MAEHKEVLDALVKKLIDEGKLIEAGFEAMMINAYQGGHHIPPRTRNEMRNVFFAGAQHLHGSIFQFLEGGEEPTENDMRRMDNVDKELKEFITDYKRQHGIQDKG